MADAVDHDKLGQNDPACNQNELAAQMLELETMMEMHWAEQRRFLRQFRLLVGRAAVLNVNPSGQFPAQFQRSRDEFASKLETLASGEQRAMETNDAQAATHMLEQDIQPFSGDLDENEGVAGLRDHNPVASIGFRSVRTMELLRTSWLYDHPVEDATCLERLVSHHLYETVSCLLVIANAIFIGIQTQAIAEQALEIASGGSADESYLDIYRVIQGLMTVAFTLDLALRWTAHGLVQFWRQKDLGWNLLDLIVVVSGLIDLAIELFLTFYFGRTLDATVGHLSLFRLLRLLRIVRVARILRVARFFRDLRLMIASILHSGKPLLWALVVVLILLYMAGIIFTTATSSHVTGGEGLQNQQRDHIAYFGTLDLSMLTLLMTMTGGVDWEQAYQSAGALGPPFSWVLVLFILVSQFAVLNLVTAVFMSNSLNACAGDAKLLIQEEMEGMRKNHNSLNHLFEAIVQDGSGILSREAFQARVQDPEVSALLNSIHLQASDAKLLFDLLDHNGTSMVNAHDFVSGCYALMGEATSFDAKVLRVEVSSLMQTVRSIEHLLKGEAAQCCSNASRIPALRRAMRPARSSRISL